MGTDDRELRFYARIRRTEAHEVCWGSFPRRIRTANVDRLLKKINFIGLTVCSKGSGRPRSVCTSNFGKHRTCGGICSHESALHIYKNPYEIGRKRAFHDRLCAASQTRSSA